MLTYSTLIPSLRGKDVRRRLYAGLWMCYYILERNAMVDTLVKLSPLLAALIAAGASFLGARAGRKQLLDQATKVLDEQAEEAIVQYKVIKALLGIMISLIDSLHRNGLLNGDGEKLRSDITNIQSMMDEDVVEKKKKTLFMGR